MPLSLRGSASAISSAQVDLKAESGEEPVAELAEVRAWYLYDFANSPYWQIMNLLQV